MKTKIKKSTARASTRKIKAKGPRTKTDSSRKSIENRDLNGEEGQRTNASREEEWDINKEDKQQASDTSVEDEQDREAKRRLDDAHPDELLK